MLIATDSGDGDDFDSVDANMSLILTPRFGDSRTSLNKELWLVIIELSVELPEFPVSLGQEWVTFEHLIALPEIPRTPRQYKFNLFWKTKKKKKNSGTCI